jgi:hypothetical protein
MGLQPVQWNENFVHWWGGPLDPLLGAPLFQKQADVGVGRGPGGPPHFAFKVFEGGCAIRAW